MRLPNVIAAVCSACIAAVAACAGAPAPSPGVADARCYDLAYERSDAVILLAERIEVWLTAADSGRAVWLTGERRTLMVEMEGRVWAAGADSISILFSTPRIRSELVLHGRGDTLRGRAEGLGVPVPRNRVPRDWVPVVAVRFDCRRVEREAR